MMIAALCCEDKLHFIVSENTVSQAFHTDLMKLNLFINTLFVLLAAMKIVLVYHRQNIGYYYKH